MKELGIYIHIPFCKRKCAYCDFISFSGKARLIEKYVEALKREIDKCKIKKEEYIVKTIYFGGGTPSFIESSYIVEILESIKRKFNILKTAEITIEINPGTITEEKLKDYYEAGINRISFGLQSTNSELLELVGRIHSYSSFIEGYKLARKVGFKNINVDLMIGLPVQTLEDVQTDLKRIIELNPEHISVYSLIVEEGTRIEEKIKNKELYLPPEELERKMYWEVKKQLEKAGYVHYEISNFAKPGFESKHNTDCWKQKEYIGIGAAACSFMDNKRYSNIESLEQYIENIENGNPNRNLVLNETLNEEDKMNEFMMLGLRKIDGVNIGDFKKIFGVNPIMKYCKTLDKLTHEDLIQVDENSIKLSKKGIDLANLVWEEFV